MQAVGIICEYNPFHNGHLYHLNEVKKLFPNKVIVLVMSGNFTQRGEPSIIDKWDKTKIALHYGIDLVIELPFPFATQSADIFAKGAITILKELGVSHLVFGSESNNVEELENIARITLSDNEYQTEVKKEMDLGNNYPTASAKALKRRAQAKINLPNDILGLTYIREIINQEAPIIPVSIKRTNDYHETELTGEISSATSIRKKLQNKEKINKTVPSYTKQFLISDLPFMEKYFNYLVYQIYQNWNHLVKFNGVDEGIETRIKKAIAKASNYQELVQLIKTKRYTYSRLNRMFTHILCGFTKEEKDKFKDISYIRVLGFSKIGQSYLNKIKKTLNLPLLTKVSSSKDAMLEKEQLTTAIYASFMIPSKAKEIRNKEYQTPPIGS